MIIIARVLRPWVASINRRSSLASSLSRFIGAELGATILTTLSATTVLPNPIFNNAFSQIQHMAVNALMKWLFLFGIMGMFMRFFSYENTKTRYISDSSYWVYLIHLPLTAIIPSLIWKLPLTGIVKFIIVLSMTTFICFTTYHYLVRNTFIGKFLNGRKYPKK